MRQGQAGEITGTDDADAVAARFELGGRHLDRAHHAVDLRLPGIADEQNVRQARWAALRRETASGRLYLFQSLASPRAPIEQLETAIQLLDKRGAAFHPVAIVAIHDAVDITDLRVVDMAADDPLHILHAVPRPDSAFSKSPMKPTAFLTLCLR